MDLDERRILINDLCSRLPYGIIVHIIRKNITEQLSCIDARSQEVWLNDAASYVDIDEIKPYLRPLSSMTEEEKEEYCDLQDRFLCSSQYPVTDAYELFDWLNEHHFDYCGLIEKRLALEAPEGMYKMK